MFGSQFISVIEPDTKLGKGMITMWNEWVGFAIGGGIQLTVMSTKLFGRPVHYALFLYSSISRIFTIVSYQFPIPRAKEGEGTPASEPTKSGGGKQKKRPCKTSMKCALSLSVTKYDLP
nr:hypothetical protein [Tanacetum cinerariifolium]